MTGRWAVAHLLAAAACVCAALPMTAGYAPGPLPALLAASAGSSAAVGLLRRRGTGGVWLASLLALAGWLLVLGWWLPRPEGALPPAVAEAVGSSLARILTTAVPVPTTLDTAAAPVVATWLAGTGSVVLLRGGRPALAAFPPVALLAGAVVLAGPTTAPGYAATAALAAALLALLALVEQRAVARLRVVATAGFAVLLAATVALAGPALAGRADRTPPDPRALVEPPLVEPAQIHPFSLLARWASEPDRELLSVRTGTPAPLRWVVLPEFTGTGWLPAPRYQAAGGLLPSSTGEAAPSTPASHEITVTGLTGGWLPAPAGARTVRGVPVAVDPATGTLLAQEPLAAGSRYTVTAALPAWGRAALAAASPPTGDELDPLRALPPGAPGELPALARDAAGSSGPYQQVSRVAAHLRAEYTFDPTAPGGSGYPSLARFLDHADPEGGRGTSAQFAAAFAVLVRALGMPSRVVVGFGPGRPVADGRYQVRTGDARAWAEVNFAELGWVAFDPTPSPSTPEDPAPPGIGMAPLFPPEIPEDPERPEDRPEPTAGPGDARPTPGAAPGPPGDPTRSGVWWAVLAGLAALTAALLVAGLRVRRGAARLRRGGPAQRLLGGWAELRDGLRMVGRRPAPAATVDEMAATVAAVTGRPPPALAAAVNATAFGGRPPPASEVDTLLAGIRTCQRAIRLAAGPLRRMTWWLDPRPLWWR